MCGGLITEDLPRKPTNSVYYGRKLRTLPTCNNQYSVIRYRSVVLLSLKTRRTENLWVLVVGMLRKQQHHLVRIDSMFPPVDSSGVQKPSMMPKTALFHPHHSTQQLGNIEKRLESWKNLASQLGPSM